MTRERKDCAIPTSSLRASASKPRGPVPSAPLSRPLLADDRDPALHTQSRQCRDDSIDDRGLPVVSFNGNRFCVKRVSYADLRLEDPCLRAIDAMSWDFLERTREHCSAFTQSIAIPSNNTRRPFAFLAAERRCPAGDAHAPPHHGPGRVPTTGIARHNVAGAQLLAPGCAPSQLARRANSLNPFR